MFLDLSVFVFVCPKCLQEDRLDFFSFRKLIIYTVKHHNHQYKWKGSKEGKGREAAALISVASSCAVGVVRSFFRWESLSLSPLDSECSRTTHQ